MDVFGKEKGPATPVPIRTTSSPAPAPAIGLVPTPELPVEAKPVEAVESAETKHVPESPNVTHAETDSLVEDVAGEVKESAHVSPPEVLVTESSPTVEAPGEAIISTIAEQTPAPSAGS